VKIAFRLSAAPRPLLLLLSPKEAVYLGSKGNGMVQAENIDSGIPNFQLDNRFGRDHHSLAHLSKFTLSEAGQACRASRVFLIHYGAAAVGAAAVGAGLYGYYHNPAASRYLPRSAQYSASRE
jgi:hypothetical protein